MPNAKTSWVSQEQFIKNKNKTYTKITNILQLPLIDLCNFGGNVAVTLSAL